MFGELVTGDYFSTLGLEPARGRFFSPEEDSTPGAHPVAVMNYATWQQRFGGAPDIVGRTLRINNVVFTVIGVAPPEFIGVNAIFGPDLWIPAAMAEQLLPNEMQNALTDRGKADLPGRGAIEAGRHPGAGAGQPGQPSRRTWRVEYPDSEQGHTVTVLPIRDVLFASASTSVPV